MSKYYVFKTILKRNRNAIAVGQYRASGRSGYLATGETVLPLELVQNGAALSESGGSKQADFTELLSQIVTGGNRVLVFSQFTSFLRMAQSQLIAANPQLSTLYLDGSTPLTKRNQMVETFQHGEAQVFFISLKAGGLGST